MPAPADPNAPATATPAPADQFDYGTGIPAEEALGVLSAPGRVNGTGYIGFGDYIRGNRDALQAEQSQLSQAANTRDQAALTGAKGLIDTAATGTPAALEQQMTEQLGPDATQTNDDLFREWQDSAATRAATGTANAAPAPAWGLSKASGATAGGVDPSVNPYSTVGKKLENRGTLAGDDAAETAIQQAGSSAAQTANMSNWGGVFDALQQNAKGAPGYGSAGAGFDATLFGSGAFEAQGRQAKGNAAGLDDYFSNAINTNAQRANDTYAGTARKPPVAAPATPTWEPGTGGSTSGGYSSTGSDDSGNREATYGAGPNYFGGNTAPAQTDSEGNQTNTVGGGAYDQPVGPNGQDQQYDPDDPYGRQNAGGG